MNWGLHNPPINWGLHNPPMNWELHNPPINWELHNPPINWELHNPPINWGANYGGVQACEAGFVKGEAGAEWLGDGDYSINLSTRCAFRDDGAWGSQDRAKWFWGPEVQNYPPAALILPAAQTILLFET